jgi:DNA polymerase elongation subunit (family B)
MEYILSNKMKYDISDKILFLDIETDSLNIEDANLKFIGCMNEKGEVWMAEWNEKTKEELIKKIDTAHKIITFNGENFDLPILSRHGVNIPRWQSIDVFSVFKTRAVLLKPGGYKSYSLKNLIKEVGIKTDGKGTIDYHIFMKNKWTPEEYDEIYTYLKQDLVVTKQLWDFLISKFDSLKDFISDQDAKNFKHITSSTGAYGYKAICCSLGLKEEYIDSEEHSPYEGAYVMAPLKEHVHGDVLYVDATSLYPMLYVHSNLFSSKCLCCTDEEKWHGNDMFKIEGKYCSKQQGKIENLIKKLFLQRKEYKIQHDPKEFAIKLILNSIYGTSSKQSFKHLYSKYTASDCTFLARQIIEYAKKTFNDAGFEVIYADTDSNLINLNGKTKEECLALSKKISYDVSHAFPFPWEEFDFKLEDEIDYIQFFKDKTGQLLKKNYIYINKKGKMIIKGLDVIKKNCSDLGLHIFEEHLKKQILERKDCLFDKSYIDGLITDAIKKNKLIISKTFNIKDHGEYDSKTSIYNLIKEKYGMGEIKMIKNHKIGAGKGVKYCSLEEAEQLNISDLDLDDVYKELSPFIKDYHTINVQEKLQKMKEKRLLREETKRLSKIDPKQKKLF